MSSKPDTEAPYMCGECGAEFPEPIPVQGDTGHSELAVGHECPQCGDSFSEQFTREMNIRDCVHSTTQDVHGDNGVYEVCPDCGAQFGLHGERVGTKTAWAVPPA